MDGELPLLTFPQLQNQLRIEFARCRRYGYPLSVMALHLDRLDHLRDLYGAAVRRDIVNRVLEVVRNHVRLFDLVAWQQDRMILVLPHTDTEGAEITAHRLQGRVGELAFEVQGRSIELSLTAGITCTSADGPLFYDALLKNALLALQEAREDGGGTVQVFAPAPDGGGGGD